MTDTHDVARQPALEGIRRSIALYSQLLDDGRFEEWGALFHEDAEFGSVPGGHLTGSAQMALFCGRRAIVEAISQVQLRLQARHPVLHFGGNPLIEVQGQTAKAWWDFMVLYLKPEGTEIAHAGRYFADLVWQDGRWLFIRRISVRTGHTVPVDLTPPPGR